MTNHRRIGGVVGVVLAAGVLAGTSFESAGATAELGRTNSVETGMLGPSKLTGLARLPDGRPAAGVAVRIIGLNSDYLDTPPKTQADGGFEVQFDARQFRDPNSSFCILARDPERNLAVAQDITEETGALDLRLAPGLTLAGSAEYENKPITNATATLVFWTGQTGRHLPGMAVGTNIPGRFEIPALPTGRRYGLYVSAPGFGQKYVNASESETESKRIVIDPVQLKLANLRMAGRVVDSEDKPVAGASVNFYGEGQPNGSDRTDGDGRFHFDRVCEGSVRVYAYSGNLRGDTAAAGGQTNLVLKLGETSNYGPGAKTYRLRGVVTDPEGTPVSGAQVAVFPSPSNRARTGTNGAFTLNWTKQPYVAQSGRVCSLVVREPARSLAAAMALSENATNVEVRLQPAFAVAGRVQDTAGRPLANAQVNVYLQAAQIFSEVNESLVWTDADGRFEAKTLPRGPKYMVSVLAQGYGRMQRELPVKPEGDRVELPPFILPLADRVVAGQVVNAENKPVAGVSVSISGVNQPNGVATTDSRGRFSLKVCPGSLQLFASGPGGFGNRSATAGDTNVVLQLGRSESTGRSSAARTPRNLAPFGIAANAVPAGKPMLLCLFDAEQPPSRRAVQALASRYPDLHQKGLEMAAIQANLIPASRWQAWTNATPVPFALGCANAKAPATKWASEVSSLPWLILMNESGYVVAEGFAFDELKTRLGPLLR